jgi:ubiquitin C-terminal hydrolase
LKIGKIRREKKMKDTSLSSLDTPIGLPNYGNTCFVNVILQSLANCDHLYDCVEEDYLRFYEVQQELKNKADTCETKVNPEEKENFQAIRCDHNPENPCLLCLMEKCFLLIRYPQNSDVTTFFLKKLIESLNMFPMKVFVQGRQEDCHELLMNILFAFELYHENQDKKTNSLLMHNESTISLENSLLEQERRKTSKSLCIQHPRLEKLFHGRLSQEIECLKCHSISIRQESFIDLALNIQNSTTLETSIQEYFKIIKFSGKDCYDCSNCQQKTEANQFVSLVYLPKILCVHLKRFYFSGNNDSNSQQLMKINHFVSFPLELSCENLQNPIIPRQQQQRQQHQKKSKDAQLKEEEEEEEFYELRSVIVHRGESMNNGHYVCYLQREPNRYFAAPCPFFGLFTSTFLGGSLLMIRKYPWSPSMKSSKRVHIFYSMRKILARGDLL